MRCLAAYQAAHYLPHKIDADPERWVALRWVNIDKAYLQLRMKERLAEEPCLDGIDEGETRLRLVSAPERPHLDSFNRCTGMNSLHAAPFTP